MSLLIVTASLALGGCDAWPTVVNNRSAETINYRYHQSSYQEWSQEFHLESGKASRLSREHWVQDILGLELQDGNRNYNYSYNVLAPLRSGCSSWFLARRFKFTPDCYVTYWGNGRLTASFLEPQGLTFQEVRDGG
jgi:hypothetical protein